MAKVTPPQEIPSGLLDGYRQALGEKRPDNGVRKRYPYRVPPMQTLVGHPSTAQKGQRLEFLDSVAEYEELTQGQRQEWYSAGGDITPALWYYDFKMQQYLLSKIANKEISLGANTHYSVPIAQDGSYVWVGRDLWPSKLIKVTKADLSVETVVTFPEAFAGMKDLVQDATYLWCLFNCSPAKLCRVPKADPTNYTAYTFAAGENEGKSLVDDGTYLWCGLYPTHPKIVRVEKADPTQRTTYAMNEVDGNLIDLSQDATYVWAICGNSPPGEPAVVVRIQKSDANQRIDEDLSGTNPTAVCILSDGNYLWCGCAQEDPKETAKLWRILKSDLTQQTIYTITSIADPAPGESSWLEDIIINGDYLWCLPTLHNPKIFKVLRSDPADKSGWNVLFLGKQLFRLLLDGNFLWGSFFYSTTGYLYKIYKYLKPYS